MESIIACRRPWALVPIKESRLAKRRLSPHIDARVRQEIFSAMIADVFAALSASRVLCGFAAVTLDPAAREMAGRYGGRVIESGAGHNGAVLFATRELVSSQAADAVLTVPMDIPLITAEDVDEIFASHDRMGVAMTIVPSRDLRGTNAMLTSPPGCIAPCFGENSFIAHREAARRARMPYAVTTPPNVTLDIDHPEDIDRLLYVPRNTHTHTALARAGYRPASLGSEIAEVALI